MKINLGKLAAVLAQILVAAPAVAAAVKPVVEAVKKPKAGGKPRQRSAPGDLYVLGTELRAQVRSLRVACE